MKKLITILVIFAITTSINAQWGKRVKGDSNMVTKTRNVSNYDRVAVGGSFDVKLIEGEEGKLTLRVDENLLQYLITEVKDGKLKIKWKKGMNISHRSDILVTVPFKDIDEVSLAGSGDVYSEDTIKATNFKTALSGSGDIKVKVNATDINTALSGSGDISIAGTTGTLKCAISGSGNISAYELISNEADARIAGSGNIKLNVKDNLKARISGSGNIHYKGDPKRQDTKVSGSGNVSSR